MHNCHHEIIKEPNTYLNKWSLYIYKHFFFKSTKINGSLFSNFDVAVQMLHLSSYSVTAAINCFIENCVSKIIS